jgi:hypothetical protein
MRYFSFVIINCITALISGCTEPIDISETENFEDALVIEATITNELKFQKINLTRTFKFEDDGPKAESNADVKIVDGFHNTFNFIEQDSGVYMSNIKFEANQNTDYQLFIKTENGKEYSSNSIQLTNITQMDSLYASREINDLGNESMTIFVNSFDATQQSNYYRYEYEETYKIIAPFWSNTDAYVIDLNPPLPPTVATRTRVQEERICYNTVYSNSIIQTKTSDLFEDRVFKFPIRIISRDDAIITHRYSILVKQYVQSSEAFLYYDVLNKLSSSDNLFSQIQPGFINSNIFSIENPNDKVLGFFEVSSMSSKRIYFNYEDFFFNEPLPPYFIECPLLYPPLVGIEGRCLPTLIGAISTNEVKFFTFNTDPPPPCEGPYVMVWRACGDCTALGTNIKPDFWTE